MNLKFSKSLKIVVGMGLYLMGALLPLGAVVTTPPHSWDEVLLELADIRHDLKTAQVDFDILRDKLHKGTSSALQDGKIQQLEKKLAHLEEIVGKLTVDLKTIHQSLGTLANQITQVQQEHVGITTTLEDMNALKGTLQSISKAMKGTSSLSSYKVKPGDSLSLIAKTHKISLEALRKCNPSLKNDTIRVGQELQLPHAPE